MENSKMMHDKTLHDFINISFTVDVRLQQFHYPPVPVLLKYRQTGIQTDGLTDGGRDGQTDRRLDGWKEEQLRQQTAFGCRSARLLGC